MMVACVQVGLARRTRNLIPELVDDQSGVRDEAVSAVGISGPQAVCKEGRKAEAGISVTSPRHSHPRRRRTTGEVFFFYFADTKP